MKYFLFTLLLGAIFFTGCASQYIVVLTNGRHVVAQKKPHLEGFNFVFLDLNGRTNSIPSEYVRAVMPAAVKSTNNLSR
jgi:hypothetical protein